MVFKRIRDITLAAVHDGLDAMESPVSMLNQYLRDLESEIEQAQEAVVKQTLIEKKFNEYKNDAKHMADKRMRQATLAVEAGAEELARRALRDKKQYAAKVEQYEEMGAEAHQKVLELKEQLKEMKEKYYQLRDRKMELISRANAAKTKKQMNIVLSKFDSESTLKGFKRMEERIIEWETEAEVRRVRPNEIYEQQLAALEPDEAVEKELAALKAGNTVQHRSDHAGANGFVQKEKTQA